MKTRARLSWVVLSGAFLLSGCGGFQKTYYVDIPGGKGRVALDVPSSSSPDGVYMALVDFYLFPLDFVIGSGFAIAAAVSDQYSLRYGAGSWLLSLLPGYTIVNFGDHPDPPGGFEEVMGVPYERSAEWVSGHKGERHVTYPDQPEASARRDLSAAYLRHVIRYAEDHDARLSIQDAIPSEGRTGSR